MSHSVLMSGKILLHCGLDYRPKLDAKVQTKRTTKILDHCRGKLNSSQDDLRKKRNIEISWLNASKNPIMELPF